MLCPYCKTYAGAGDLVCPSCGRLIPRSRNRAGGAQSIRQGRPGQETAPDSAGDEQDQLRACIDPAVYDDPGDVPVYADPEIYGETGQPLSAGMHRPSGTTMNNPVVHSSDLPPRPRRRKFETHQHQINWAKVIVALILSAVALLVGGIVVLTRTHPGQRLMARMGFSASAAALWEVGGERMDVGDVSGAIDFFLRAAGLDGEENVNVPGLLQLGGAYESAGMMDSAEALYAYIYQEVVPSALEAYTNNIRILLSQDRLREAADLMRLAYSKTGSETYLAQRRELVPEAPGVNIMGAYYEEDKDLVITSPQGFDVYYTFDEDAKLPEEGQLFREAIRLTEANWHLRAVCVNGELVSDELSSNYYISMPSPGQPYCNLAPNTYASRRQVQLWVSIEEKADPEITIFYTIDGSMPNADSPVYNGDPIWLPAGDVTLRAVAVNQYGKAGNMLERTFKFTVKPVPLKAYSTSDATSGITLNETQREEFVKKYGEAASEEEVERSDLEGTCRKYRYAWGYATFNLQGGRQTLVELHFENDTFKAPRSTSVGDTLSHVVSKFRDMGQVESPSGNRGLYETRDGSTGRIYLQEDGGHVIRYDAVTPDYHTWRLEYVCSPSDVVTAITLTYLP